MRKNEVPRPDIIADGGSWRITRVHDPERAKPKGLTPLENAWWWTHHGIDSNKIYQNREEGRNPFTVFIGDEKERERLMRALQDGCILWKDHEVTEEEGIVTVKGSYVHPRLGRASLRVTYMTEAEKLEHIWLDIPEKSDEI